MWRSIWVPRMSSGLQFGDLRLDFQVVVGDERFRSAGLGLAPQLAGKLSRIRPQPHDLEAELGPSDARRCDGVRSASPKMKTRLSVR